VTSAGSIVSQSGGITLAGVVGGWIYLNFGSDLSSKTIQVTSAYRDDDSGARGTVYATVCGGTPAGATCTISNNNNTVAVATFNPANTALAPHAFYIAAF
jgi:hypothetical protein